MRWPVWAIPGPRNAGPSCQRCTWQSAASWGLAPDSGVDALGWVWPPALLVLAVWR